MPAEVQIRETLVTQATEPGAVMLGDYGNCQPVVRFRRHGLRIGESYFFEQSMPSYRGLDLMRMAGVLQPYDSAGWSIASTIVLDLQRTEDELLRQMEKTTRYEIRRGTEQGEFAMEMFLSPQAETIARFCDFYDLAANYKFRRPIYRPRLYSLAAFNMLLLTSAATTTSTPLVWHAYVAGKERIMLLYSASSFRENEGSAARNLAARANRCLHWNDMVQAKRAGAALYDMGGIDIKNKSPKTSRIAQFKRGFGGEIVSTYARTFATSLKGRLALGLLSLATSKYQ